MTETARGAFAPDPLPAQALFNRVLPADQMSVRQTLTDMHARLAPHVSADVLGRLELVLAEVMNNIVLHGTGTRAGHGRDAGTGDAGGVGAAGAAARGDAGDRASATAAPASTTPAQPAPTPPRRIHVSAACHRNGVACAVTDDGVGLPPACLIAPPPPDLDGVESLPEGGFGWLIIHGLTRSLVYFREGSRNLLAFNIPTLESENEGAPGEGLETGQDSGRSPGQQPGQTPEQWAG